MFGMRKGQGATEYLVLLAVVLVIALVSIALLGFFPGLTTDAKVNQSITYWKGASPIAITAASITPAGTLNVVIQNNAPDSISALTMRVTNANGSTTIVTVTPTSTALGPGASTTAATAAAAAPTCVIGSVVTFTTVNFTYSTSSFAGLTQVGSRDLIVRCS
jgi:hypothetical protein